MNTIGKKTIITGGFAYTDIDVLACACGYNQCMELQGMKSQVILKAPFNETICDSIKKWEFQVSSETPASPELYNYVLVDVSDPKYFEKFVVHDNITEVLDHHYGFEAYWKARLGDKGCVEHVGSCATLIWEKFKQFGLERNLGTVEANLLFTAIFSNTLNLQAEVTTKRDIEAFEGLKEFIQLPNDWIADYYSEVSQAIIENPLQAIKKDTKHLVLSNENIRIAQLELWDSDKLLKSEVLSQFLIADPGKNLLIVSEVSTRQTHFVCCDPEMQSWISEITKANFYSNIASAERLWMRKEVLRELQKVFNESLPVGWGV